ncbi:tripartite tricarboxylate transporter TctB family protein [Stutzerimonas urumqiensis]|uniref:tripartite tricarboxylate transporter TctB family protein n=1 Tax=Stutzerimonas urumqiensis TaxID=638269 RepID=UPI003BAAA3EC
MTDALRSRWANPDVWLGAFWLLAALVFVLYLVPNHIDEAPMVENPMQSPRWLPSLAGWLIVALSVALIVDALTRPAPAASATVGERSGARRILLMLIALGTYWLLLEPLGAIATGILATLILFVAHPVRTPWLYGLAIALPWLVCLLFIHVLNVPLPSGTLWD